MSQLCKIILNYFFFIILLMFCNESVSTISAKSSYENESLKYIISYKWGLIHKDAGEATLSLKNQNGNYNIILTAKTKPWADKFYKVRDTLKSVVKAADLTPISYLKLTHEKGEFKKDEIKYKVSGNITTGITRRFRKEKGKWNITEKNLTAQGPVYDMLSVFYYIRQLDFSNMSKNKSYTATIFSGKRKETITIRCLGKEKIKMKDKSERDAYHIQFNFTRNGGKKSSDDMDTWISTDGNHIPLYLVGKLPVGEIRAYLI